MNRFKRISTILSMVILSACASQKGSAPPPTFYLAEAQPKQAYVEKFDVVDLQNIEPAAGIAKDDYRVYTANPIAMPYQPYTSAAGLNDFGGNNCTAQERFDHQALLAYQWGRNRIGLNFNQVDERFAEADEVKMTYRIKLQKAKSRAENCLNDSAWQGIIGSGYNELYLR